MKRYNIEREIKKRYGSRERDGDERYKMIYNGNGTGSGVTGIRVDANEIIAMGHLVRCMSIAVQLKRMGQKVIFIISENYAENYIVKNGFDCICLENHYNEKEKEIEELLYIIGKENIDRMLIDSYEVTACYMSEIRKCAGVIYIDDLNLFRYPADIIINYVDSADMIWYSNKGYDYDKEIFLLGSRYVPLRPEFADKRIHIRQTADRVFVTTGGTDSYNMLIGILDKMKECELAGMKKCVVAGKFYDRLGNLTAMAEEDNTIEVYHDISDICAIMRKCDMAVSAGGTTMIELSACGIPAVCFSVADNQMPAVNAFSEKGLIRYAGDVRENREKVIDNIIGNIRLMKDSYELREELSEKAKRVVDGRGAERIAEAIMRTGRK